MVLKVGSILEVEVKPCTCVQGFCEVSGHSVPRQHGSAGSLSEPSQLRNALGHLQSQQSTTASTTPAVAQTLLRKARGQLLITESFLACSIGLWLLQGLGNVLVLAGQPSL